MSRLSLVSPRQHVLTKRAVYRSWLQSQITISLINVSFSGKPTQSPASIVLLQCNGPALQRFFCVGQNLAVVPDARQEGLGVGFGELISHH